MSKACKPNNEAAFYIKNGEYEKAIKLLQQATKFLLRRTTTAMTSSPPPRQDFIHHYNNVSDFCTFFPGPGATLDSCFLTIATLPRTKRTEQITTSATSYTVFTAPLLVDQQTVSLGDTTSSESLSYVLVYNLALAHHCMAMNYTDDSDHHLLTEEQRQQAKSYQQKAVLLYEKSHSLLVRASKICDATPVMHSLVILCNLGQLHYARGDEQKSNACFQNLLSILFYVIDRKLGSPAPSAQSGADILLTEQGILDRFFLIVMPRLQKECVAAAA